MKSDELEKCEICPIKCKKNRYKELGYCKTNDKIKIAKAYKHLWEEPILTGKNGSGTVFFSGCNLNCVYCQNYELSKNAKGIEITIDELKNVFLKLQKEKATNINLVTPTHFSLQIKEAIIKAKDEGLNIPIVYNTSGYDNSHTLKELDGLIDIYLTDMKYYDDKYAIKYSKAPNYFNICKKAISEMYKQVGKPIYKNNVLIKGITVRHLILPGLVEDSKKILKYLYDTYKDNIIISIMNQYTPLDNVKEIKELNRKITKKEYDEVINYALDIGITNAYIQEDDTQSESFIPNFDLKEIRNYLNK